MPRKCGTENGLKKNIGFLFHEIMRCLTIQITKIVMMKKLIRGKKNIGIVAVVIMKQVGL